MNSVIENLPDISFIDNATIEEVLNQMINDYQEKYKEITGKNVSLAQADPYRLIMYACSLQIYQTMQNSDFAGKQGLLKYSAGDFLDNIAPLRGIKRNEAAPATTVLKFSIDAAMESAVSIPAGSRATNGNNIFFATDEYVEIAVGETEVTVTATCTEVGNGGNGFQAGEINTLVQTLPYISSVVNTTETGGGSDREEDDSLRDRIYLAASSFSVAGPKDAYEYWTKSVSPNITDVKVVSLSPCEVDVCFILDGGELPEEALIQEVATLLNDSNIRPLTDHVTVQAPTTEEYNIELTYYINESDRAAAENIQALVDEAINAYIKWQSSKIGRDINPSYLISKIVGAGAKRVEVISPSYTSINETSVPVVGTIKVTYGGLEND